MKSLVTSASCPSRRMVSPMVDSDMVAARCSTGTIQHARAMNTSVATRPMRMIASDGDGRLRKRAIAPTKTRMNAVMAPTNASAICQISIPWNMTSPLLVELGNCRDPEQLLFRVEVHQHHLGLVRERRLALLQPPVH